MNPFTGHGDLLPKQRRYVNKSLIFQFVFREIVRMPFSLNSFKMRMALSYDIPVRLAMYHGRSLLINSSAKSGV